MLKKRSDINARIDRLGFEGCLGLRTWQKKWLGELVGNLEIEGKVIDVKDLDSDDDWGSDNDNYEE